MNSVHKEIHRHCVNNQQYIKQHSAESWVQYKNYLYKEYIEGIHVVIIEKEDSPSFSVLIYSVNCFCVNSFHMTHLQSHNAISTNNLEEKEGSLKPV